MADLGEFEGRDVLQVKAIITKTGDGLSESLMVEPLVHHVGDESYVVMKVRTGKIRHDPIGATDALARVEIHAAETAMFLDDEVIVEAIARQEQRNAEAAVQREKAKREAKGEYDLDYELSQQHTDGAHAEARVEGCVQCDMEAGLEKAGL